MNELEESESAPPTRKSAETQRHYPNHRQQCLGGDEGNVARSSTLVSDRGAIALFELVTEQALQGMALGRGIGVKARSSNSSLSKLSVCT